MQEYLWKSSFREKMDGLGLHVLMLMMCMGWFMLLWGLRLQSLLAGLAAYGLCLAVRRQNRHSRLARKEKKLRQQLGGEIQLESLLLQPANRACFALAMLLSVAEDMELKRMGQQGVLGWKGGETVFLSFLQVPFSGEVTARDVLLCQQQARQEGAASAWLCVPCPVTEGARQQAREGVPVRLVEKARLVQLLGAVCPATDRQLVALGKRKKAHAPRARRLTDILRPQKAGRYALYGGLLLILYEVTGLLYYAFPGLVCILLAAFSRCFPER